MIKVVARLNPLESSAVYCDIEAGLSISEILGTKSERLYVTVNDVSIPFEAWDDTYPVDGELVVVTNAPQGIESIILAIAYAIGNAAGAAFTAVAGALGTTAFTVGTTAISWGTVVSTVASVAMTAVSVLVRPQTPSLPVPGSNRFNQLAQGSNQGNIWGNIPKLYGTFRITPPLGGNYYSEVKDDKQYLHLLLCLGHGPLKIGQYIVGKDHTKLLDNPTFSNPLTILVGDTPISEMAGIELQIGTIPAIMNPVKYGGAGVKRIYTQDIEEDNTSYALNRTANVSYKEWPDTWIPEEDQENEWIHTTTEEPLFVEIDLLFQVLYLMAGNPVAVEVEGGVVFQISYRRSGTTQWQPAKLGTPYNLYGFTGTNNWAVRRKEKSPFRVTNGFETAKYNTQTNVISDYMGAVPVGQTYDIKIRRSHTGQAQYTQSGMADAIVTAFRFYKNSMAWNQLPHQYTDDVILMACRIKATGQLNGTLDPISILATSVLQTYDGTQLTEPVATNNPAWIYADILRGSHLQTSVRMSDEEIDWAKLKEWADYCELGSDNRKFTYNWYHQEGETMLERLRAVASTGRAAWAISDGMVSVVMDNNFVPVQMVSPRNSRNFELTKTYTKVPNALRVQWVNPVSWIQDEIFVLDDWFYRTDGQNRIDPFGRRLDVFADYQAKGWTNEQWQTYRNDPRWKPPSLIEVLETQGVTDKQQAFREGRYYLAALRLRPETFKVEIDIENLVAQRGDCVLLAHDALLRGRASGRIKQITNNTDLLLDEEVDLTPETGDDGNPVEFCLRVRIIDNSGRINSVVLPLQAGTGPTNVVTTTSAVGVSPGDLFVFGPMSKEVINAKIVQIDYSPDLSATLTMTAAQPGILEADIGEIEDDGGNVPDVPPELRKPPIPIFEDLFSNVDDLEVTPDGLQARVTAVWSIPIGSNFSRADDVYVHYSISGEDGVWKTLIRPATLTSTTIDKVPADTWITVYLQSRNEGNGKFSDKSVTKTLLTPGAGAELALPPINLALVPFNYLTSNGQVHYEIKATWQVVGFSSSIEIQWQPLDTSVDGSAEWSGLMLGSAAANHTITDVLTGIYTVRVRNYGIYGNFSDWLTGEIEVAMRDVPPQPPTNLVAMSMRDGVHLTWDNPPDEDFAGIEIWESNYNDRIGGVVDLVVHPPAELLTKVGNPTDSYTHVTGDLAWHYYWIRAYDAEGNTSSWEKPGNNDGVYGRAGIIGDGLPPPPPANLVLTPDTWQCTLSWEQTQEIPDLAGTQVYFSTTNDRGEDGALLAQYLGYTDELFATHLRLETGVTYYYWIRNLDVEGLTSTWLPEDRYGGAAALIPPDPGKYLDLLRDAITETQLYPALRTLINSLSNGDGTFIDIQAIIEPLMAMYTLKIQQNYDGKKYVAGFGLSSEIIDGAPVSNFIIAADRFAVAAPAIYDENGNLISEEFIPFVIQTTGFWAPQQYVDGTMDPYPGRVWVPPGVYIENAFIKNASISGAKIQAQSITADHIDTRGLIIRDHDGNPLFGAGVLIDPSQFLGQISLTALEKLTANNVGVFISAGAIGNAYIGNVIESLDYLPASQDPNTGNTIPGQGWKIDKQGNIECNDLEARGTVSSDNYVPNMSGWKIYKNGYCEFNTGVFRGTLSSDTLLVGTDFTLGQLSEQILIASLNISSTGQYFSLTAAGTPISNTIITFFVNNIRNVAWSAKGHVTDVDEGVDIELGIDGDRRRLVVSQMTSGPVNYNRVVVRAAAGEKVDEMTVYRLVAESGVVTAFLANNYMNFAADSSGHIAAATFDNAKARFRVFLGAEEVTGDCTFSVVSQTASTVTVFSDPTSGNHGYYQVTSLSAEDGTAVIRATYSGVNYDRTLTMKRTKTVIAGADGQRGSKFFVFSGDFSESTWTEGTVVDDLVAANSEDGAVALGDFVTLVNLMSGYSKSRQRLSTGWSPVSAFINGDMIVDGTITADMINVGISGNLIQNSEAWHVYNYSSGAWYFEGVAFSGNTTAQKWQITTGDWHPKGGACFAIEEGAHDGAMVNNVSVFDFMNAATDTYFAVEAGKTYEFTAYTGAHRCRVYAELIWVGADGSPLINGYVGNGLPSFNDEEAFGGSNLAGYKRIYARGTAPADAFQVICRLVKNHTKEGHTSSWLFATRVMFCETTPSASRMVPWSPGGVTTIGPGSVTTGRLISASAQIGDAVINTAHIQDASITTAKIGDATIERAKIKEAAIDSLRVQGNSVTTTGHIAYSPEAAIAGGSWTSSPALQMNFQVAPQRVVLIITVTAANAVNSAGNVTITVKRNGGNITTRSFSLAAGLRDTYTFTASDNPAAGAVNYQLLVSGSGAFVVTYASITALGSLR